ncbi:MAG: hypothetical protein LLF94_10110 [Chlamydiales bacterium]|nr:hypothetical protein [Chlamydiales bacterium]
MSEGILGVIAYLDSNEVDNLLASIEGGLVEQFVEKFRDSKTKKGEGGIGISSTSLGASVESVREEASEAIKRTTPVSRLSALRKILLDNNYVRQVNAVNIDERTGFIEGELVEVYGSINPSAFGEFIDIAVEFMKIGTQFSDLFGNAIKIDPRVEQGIKYLEYATSKGIPIQISCAKSETAKQGFDFASILVPDFLKTNKDSLTGTFNVLGRIKRVLERNEVIYLYDLMPGMSKMSREQFKALIDNFAKKPIPGMNINITERDLRIKYPSVVVSPIAMYS